MDALAGFLIAAVALAGSPGPATLSLAAAGAAFGAPRAVAYLIGLVAGMVAVMAIVASGVVGLLMALP
ncbi:MAG: LysE family translocator, partial [Reyranella sp.]